ncbi:MAG: adenylate/guanylate cyclase domain-containing protein [Actinobacteria bacterium]|nr:adenylate/guanylate cyclase domain-containing protein [Actinomycetota bacterium]
MRDDFPSGTVTFLFTDVEGSTRLLRELGAEGYAGALAEHRRVVREVCASQGGVEVDTQGDAFFFAFPTAPGALEAARATTEALHDGPVRVRIGLHTGTPLLTDEGYVGGDVHRAARIAASGNGGQVLVSASTSALVELELRDLGEHRFKDLSAAERVYQLGDGDFPPLRSLYWTNLPVPATPFVGRAGELTEVVELLFRHEVRLLTLTGPGGTGKTRLALQAAAETSDRYPDGIWWVPLAPLMDPAVVPAQIAQALGATGELCAHVSDKRLLLLLDNFEHLLDAAPGVASLLGACPNLEVLATSRELLRLQAEFAYAVPTLSDYDGAELFRSRALAAAGTLGADGSVGDLCRRLDNLPLALELAAARTRHLTPHQLLERVSQRLDLLRGGRDADPRQQTLRATIEWSHALLEAAERQLFARLSVFAGGCTLDAAEAVCDGDLDTVASLVDKSLLRKSGDRFWMLETIREFSSEQLDESGEAEKTRRRHAEFFLDHAPSLGFTIESIEDGAIQRHDIAVAELSNFRAAIDWGLRTDPELGLRIASALENFWVSYSPFDAERIFEELEERVGETASPELRALATRNRGNLSIMTGHLDAGLRLYEQSLELYREIGDEHGVAILEHRVGVNVYPLGEKERARRLLEQSLAKSKQHGFRVNEIMVTASLGSFDYRDGDIERGLEVLEQSAAAAREVGFKWWEANMRNALATYAIELGRFVEAEQHGRAELVLAHEMGDRRHAVQALGHLARLAVGRGDTTRAGRLWGALEAEELRGPVGQRPRMHAWGEEREAWAAIVLADPDEALERGRVEGRRYSLEQAVGEALADA